MGYCNWDKTSEANIHYHDNEWGVPLHDDRGQFEYSHLQACGIINDHDKNCHRYKEIVENYPTVSKRRYLERQISYYGA